jgi:hypothetical protein
MTMVLLFAEHELTRREVTETLQALAALRVDGDGQVDVTVLVPCSATWAVTLMDDLAASHGSSASSALGDARHDATVAMGSARRTLRHVLSAVRGGGHHARGEVVTARDAVRELATEAVASGATTAVVVSSPHRLSYLLHRDLEHRLRRAGLAHVVRLGGRLPAL